MCMLCWLTSLMLVQAHCTCGRIQTHAFKLASFCEGSRSSTYTRDRVPESGWRDSCQKNQGGTGQIGGT